MRATLQARSSSETFGSDARYISTDPPVTAAATNPQTPASSRPSTALPRRRILTRQSRSEVNRPVTAHASSIDGAVSLPSKLLVSARSGIRRRDGNNPK